jgi:hypothetical protein
MYSKTLKKFDKYFWFLNILLIFVSEISVFHY